MSCKSARYLIAGTILSLTCSTVFAQEVVHALTGIVTGVNNSAHTITLKTDDGSQVTLNDDTERHPNFEFDKSLQSEATSSADFRKVGDPVIVYYFGLDQNREAVAVKDLGAAPLKSSSGEIKNWDRHHHIVTIKTASGALQTFQLDDKTAIETPLGVVNGDKFEGQNGDRVSIGYSVNGATNKAVFMSQS